MAMTAHEFKSARLKMEWTQTQAAARLGMTQAYLNFLENGKRRLTPALVRRATSAYGLSPEVLPVADTFTPAVVDNQHLAELLAQLGYPGFSYLRPHLSRKNPYEVLLTALAQKSLEPRVAEALPWVAMKYARPNSWLVQTACKFNLQNKLGFVVKLAQKTGKKTNPQLDQLENMLEDSRLAKADFFYRPPRTESEREWILANRTEDAAHWNLLTDMKPEHLQYA